MVNGDYEREMQLFLFEKALLICKEIKDSNKNRLTKSNTLMKKKRTGGLQPKGKIYTNRIISIYNKSSPGNWALAVEFKDREVERFTLKFRNEEQLKLWESTLNKTKASYKSHVPNTHLLSMGQPMTPNNSQHQNMSSYFDDEDDEDEDEDEDDEEDDYQTARSRSNSVFAQQMLNMRPKMTTAHSQDATTWKSTIPTARPMPGMNLSPLPRTPTGFPSSPPTDYGVYPASPPPSSPSSPGASTNSAASSWHNRRNNDEGGSPLADIANKFMANGFDTPAPPRTQSNSVSPTSNNGRFTAPGQPHHHRRLRSQSSPNIHKVTNGQGLQRAAAAENLPQVPINSRTLYHKPSSVGDIRPVPAPAAVPRLSEANHSLQNQIERVASAATGPAPNSPGSVKIKLSYNDGIYVIMVPEEVTFVELMEKVEKKIRVVANLKSSDVLRLKYQDEDGDLITINSDDDVLMAFENRTPNTALNLFVSV